MLFFFMLLFPLFITTNPVMAQTCGSGCTQDYPEYCPTTGGTRTCHKVGVWECDSKGNILQCSWGTGSGCSQCTTPDATPTPPPAGDSCSLVSGPGNCSREAGVGTGAGFCNPYCNSGWVPNNDSSIQGCQIVQCSCDNSTRCCPMNPPAAPPTNTPVPVSPGQPTNTPVPVTGTPPTSAPTPTPVCCCSWGCSIESCVLSTFSCVPPMTVADLACCTAQPPTATPTPIPTNTPTPTPIPTKGWDAVTGVPTSAPRQEQRVGTTAYTWICLKASQTANSAYGETLLTGDGFPTGKNIYIVGCIQTSSGFKCTTGNASYDDLLGIQKSSEHTFTSQNPIVLNATNSLSVTVTSTSTNVTNHVFYAVYQGTGAEMTGDATSLQYGTFNFSQDYKKCVTIRWDPYGRVFDAKSLEPIPNINISILDSAKNLVQLPGVGNPVTTGANGFFNFFVEAGQYYLKLDLLSSYSFTTSPSLNSNYGKAYSNLYKPDEIINETANGVHVDIPLDPGSNPPRRSDPVSISFSLIPATYSTETKIIGQVSHPLTIVTFYQGNKQIGQTTADKFGFYETIISNETIEPYTPIVPHLTKVDLTKNNISVLGVQASAGSPLARIILAVWNKFTHGGENAVLSATSQGSPVNPIPRYLEGYIYDGSGGVVKNAEVNVILVMSGKTYYQTVSDSYGRIKLYPEDLPIFEYYLKITPVNSKTNFTITTDEFIRQNQDYLNQNRINVITATKN